MSEIFHFTLIGVCPPCGEQVVQPCVCGREVKDQPCDQPQWSCGNVCGKLLPCQQHPCQIVSSTSVQEIAERLVVLSFIICCYASTTIGTNFQIRKLIHVPLQGFCNLL